MEARGGLVENVRNKGDELKDPPEGLGLNAPPTIEYQRAAANEGDCFMEARGGLVENVRNKGDELKDPPEGLGLNDPPRIEYKIAAANEGHCFMEACGGLVENVRNKGGLNDPPPIEYQMAVNVQVDIIGDQWNLKKKKIFFGGRPYKCNKVRGDPEKKGNEYR